MAKNKYTQIHDDSQVINNYSRNIFQEQRKIERFP